MDALWQELRHSARAVRRQPGFAVVVVLTLAVGIGLNTAVFSLLHSTLLAPLPYHDPGRLAMLWTEIPAEGVRESRSAYANVQDWRSSTRSFEDLATFDPTSLTVTGGEWPEQISTARVSANLFGVLGVPALLGRVFSPEEERQRAAVVVVSHEFWLRRFDGERAAIGRTIELAGTPFQVVGVMPAGFGFPDRNTLLWLPQTQFTDWEATAAQRGTGAWGVIGRLRAGVTIDRARADMTEIAARLARSYPGANAGLGIHVVPLYEHVTGHSFRLALWMLFGAVGLLLLIACANAAHLVVARGMDRGREFAVRRALGATAPRLLRQTVVENLVLAGCAGVAGILLAYGGLRLLIALAPANLPRLNEVGVHGAALGYAAAVSLVAGLAVGVAPALRTARNDLSVLMREGSSSAGGRGYRGRGMLIVMQCALAVVLVFGAQLLIRSFLEIRSVDPGFASEDVLMANLSVEEPSRRVSFYESVVREVGEVPGVTAAGVVEDLFISGAPSRAIVVEGGPTTDASFTPMRIDAIAGELFAAIGVRILEGRGFSASDGPEAPPVAIINEAMARRFWPGQSPVGRRFRSGGPESAWVEVVGVVSDMRRQGMEREAIAQAFRPYSQEPSRNMNLLVKSRVPSATLAAAVRARVAAIDATIPLYRVGTVAQALDGQLLERRFQTFLLTLFAGLAMILAAGGIYGIVQYSVARRVHEMAIRTAVGASTDRLVRMVVREGVSLALPGLAAGIVCGVWLSETITALLFDVSASDPVSLLVPAAVLLSAVVLASWIPARRAARVDPMGVLRSR